RRHTRSKRDWSSDVCSSDLPINPGSTPRPTTNPSPHHRGSSDPTACPTATGSTGYVDPPSTTPVPSRPCPHHSGHQGHPSPATRSEERRVGKEWDSSEASSA